MSVVRYNLIATYIDRGVIGLILPDGNIANYRQRGIGRLSERAKSQLISMNLLRSDWMNYNELPGNFSIFFEDEEVMGKAKATFPNLNQWLKIK